MSGKIFRSILFAVSAVLLACLVSVSVVLYGYFSSSESNDFTRYLAVSVQGIETSGEEYIQSLAESEYRVTWISADGEVLFDSDADFADMENHLDREEISEALAEGFGESSRYSDTLMKKMTYCAQRLSDGSVLRISTSSGSVYLLVFNILWPVVAVFCAAVLISAVLSRKMAKSIVKPLAQLNLENPEKNDTYEELSPILHRLGEQHRQITDQLKLLARKTDEFEQIISSMSEGLVLINKNSAVISMNSAAQRIFGLDSDKSGMDFAAIDPSTEVTTAVKESLSGRHTEFVMEKNHRRYQFSISPTVSDGKTQGAVILMVDITERFLAEQSRREFTANVSHELNTPLQGILGSVELLEGGLVKKEDECRFFGHIKNETKRLILLINDIMRLSQLEETDESLTETVNLRQIADEAVGNLAIIAADKNVSFSVTGEDTEVMGVPRYIYEIIYNLCDNAIRYNVEGGSVTVDISTDGEDAVITVSDTGIGIPPEYRSRIFERFYRVDKSHSRRTGGTGLGLSIVKHAVLLHGGRIELDSEVGKGTTVRVIL